MSFGLQTPREYIDDIHGRLHDAAKAHLKGDITTVSVVSINDEGGGQMILADTGYDKRKLARRLRLCADILDPITSIALVARNLDALAADYGYDHPSWTADELAISLVQTAPAMDGVDPKDLEPAVETWLQQRRKG